MDIGNINSYYVSTNYAAENFAARQSAEQDEFKIDKKGKKDGELSEKEKEELKKLKETDRKVKQHEMAHIMAAQGLAVTPAQFQYKRGPDGQLYAVAGEVRIDTSEVPNDPEATIEKAKKIQRCALAPQDPSPQDRQVAAKARQMENKARIELMKKKQKEAQEAMKKSEKGESKELSSDVFSPISKATFPNNNFISNAYNTNFGSEIINFLV